MMGRVWPCHVAKSSVEAGRVRVFFTTRPAIFGNDSVDFFTQAFGSSARLSADAKMIIKATMISLVCTGAPTFGKAYLILGLIPNQPCREEAIPAKLVTVAQEGLHMARHLLFAITLIAVGAFLNSPAKAATDAPHCENNAANCIGRCKNPGGGTNDSKCMQSCDRRVINCLARAYSSPGRW
jgi:hypothetical protein